MKDKIFRGDIVWANNSAAFGHIQNKLRPYLIISNNKNNEYADTVLGIPLTTKIKKTCQSTTKLYLTTK